MAVCTAFAGENDCRISVRVGMPHRHPETYEVRVYSFAESGSSVKKHA